MYNDKKLYEKETLQTSVSCNEDIINKYTKLEKKFIKFREVDMEDLQKKLYEGENLYAYNYCIEEECMRCGDKVLNIIDVSNENDFEVVTAYCENCHEYTKYYIKDKRVEKTEHFVEKIKNTITKKDRRKYNLYKHIRDIDFSGNFFVYDLGFYIFMGLIISILWFCFVDIFITKNILILISLGIIPLVLAVTFGIVINIYERLYYSIGRTKYFYLSNQKNLIGDNMISIYENNNSNEEKSIKDTEIVYTDYYLFFQRNQVELLRLLKIYNILELNNKLIIEDYNIKITENIKKGNEDEAKSLYIKLYDLQKLNEKYLYNVKEIKDSLKNNYEELSNERKKLCCYSTDIQTQRILLDRDELDMLEINDNFENYKNNILSNNTEKI